MNSSKVWLLAAVGWLLSFLFSLLSYVHIHNGLILTAGFMALVLALYSTVRYYQGRVH